MIDLYLIRHAQTPANAEGNPRIIGRSPEMGLTLYGHEQAYLLAKHFHDSGVDFDRIYSSPARRALATALPIANNQRNGIQDIIQSDLLHEMSQGDWEGLLRDEVNTEEVLYLRRKHPWTFKAPHGESKEDVANRWQEFFWDSFGEAIARGDDVLGAVITHHMTIKCSLMRAGFWHADFAFHTDIENAAYVRLQYREGNFGLKIDRPF
jgi:probable phosphoglycerate mutase